MEVHRYHVETLGCKANRYDSQRLAEALEALGFCEAPPGAAAEVCVVNTCTVTHTSDRKCRQAIRRAIRRNPRARVFVTGCYATACPGVLREIEGVEGVFGREQCNEMLQVIAGGPVPEAARLEGDFGIRGFSGRGRAFVKIQDGCDFFCAYCILPYVRGTPRSRPPAGVLEEVRGLIDCGFREIVLTGIHLGLYGRDLEGNVTLADAVERVADLEGIGRVRLSSVDAPEVSERLLGAMRHPAVCAHLHLSLQSGDDAVLERMGRRYTAGEFLETTVAARQRLDRPALTGEVIVGFPGETEEGFENTLRVCREAAFSRMHVFPFSPRPGTRAARMEGRVSPEVVRERCARLRDLAHKMAVEWAESFVGRRARVLFEKRERSGTLVGYTDRYVRVSVPGPCGRVGELQEVLCTGAKGASLEGKLSEQGTVGSSSRWIMADR